VTPKPTETTAIAAPRDGPAGRLSGRTDAPASTGISPRPCGATMVMARPVPITTATATADSSAGTIRRRRNKASSPHTARTATAIVAAVPEAATTENAPPAITVAAPAASRRETGCRRTLTIRAAPFPYRHIPSLTPPGGFAPGRPCRARAPVSSIGPARHGC
jgi:hypothetical protein